MYNPIVNKRAPRLILTLLLGGSLACSFFSNLFNSGDPEASKAIKEFKAEPEALEASYHNLHILIRDDPETAAKLALEQIEARDPVARFVAIYTLANTASTEAQLDALRALLTSESLSERVLAAEALLARGDKRAIPVLIGVLNSDEELANSLPPQRAWEYARNLLLQFTVQDFGLSADESQAAAAAAQPAWQAWWEQNGGALEWFPDEGVFR